MHKIVCIGDSITKGSYSSDIKRFAYPSVMKRRLNPSHYEIVNLGVGGCTMLRNGDQPYWQENAYKQAIASEANTIIMMFGTNDAKTFNMHFD